MPVRRYSPIFSRKVLESVTRQIRISRMEAAPPSRAVASPPKILDMPGMAAPAMMRSTITKNTTGTITAKALAHLGGLATSTACWTLSVPSGM